MVLSHSKVLSLLEAVRHAEGKSWSVVSLLVEGAGIHSVVQVWSQAEEGVETDAFELEPKVAEESAIADEPPAHAWQQVQAEAACR